MFLPFSFISRLDAATVQSARTGPWSQISTWNTGTVPTAADTVNVKSGHIVTVDITTATAQTLTVNGTLSFSRVTGSSLTMVAGNITVSASGLLDMGSAASPIPAGVEAALLLAAGSGATRYSLTINNGGAFSVQGATKTPASTATADIVPGGSAVTVADGPAAMGWSVGDVITVGQTLNSSTNQTERRTIVGIAGNVLTVDSAFAYTHIALNGIRVGDLTRNVLVASAGTDLFATSAYLQTNARALSDFALAYGEFAYLGTSSNQGFSFNTQSQGLISSCTVRDGNIGIYVSGSTGVVLSHNLIYNNLGAGIQMQNSPSLDQVLYNDVYGNGSNGIAASGGFHAIVGNNVYSNALTGISVSASSSTVYGNKSFTQTGGSGFSFSGNGIIAVGNQAMYNQVHGYVVSGDSASWASNYSFSNSSNGVFINSGDGAAIVDLWLGYDPAGNSLPDGKSEVAGTAPFGSLFQGMHMNPARNFSLSAFSQPGVYALSYDQDYDTGTLRLLGDYQVAGTTLTLDYATSLRASTASPPIVLAGASVSSARVNSTSDADATTQLISILFSGADGLWHVSGTVGGTLGTLPGAGGTADFPASSPKFNLTMAAANARDGDRVDFLLSAATPDAGFQKKLLFGAAAAGLNSGRAKLTVAPSGGLKLAGTQAVPTLVDIFSGGTYYTMVDSGAFTAAYSTFSNLDSNGLQLSGSAGVSISSVTFDFIDADPTASTAAYITASGLTSNATFYALAFNASRSTAALAHAYDVLVRAPDSGLNWTLRSYGGPLSGAGFDEDPNRRLAWADATPPLAVSALAASPGPLDGQASLSWTFLGDDGGAYPLNNGAWRVFYSTDPLQAATTAQAQLQIASGRVFPGTTVAQTVSGLYAGTTFYLHVWAGDAAGNWSPLSSAATAQATDLVPPIPAGLAFSTSSPGQISISWGAVPAPDIDHYNVYVASQPPFYNVFQFVASTPTVSFLHTGLINNATYVYRLTAVDQGNDPARPGYLSVALESPQSNSLTAHTPDLIPPSGTADLSAAPGAAVGEVRLSWSAPGNDGTSGMLEAGSRYRVQYSTVAVTWSTTAAQVEISTFGVSAGDAQITAVAGLVAGTSYFFALWTADESGNWSGMSNVSTSMPRGGAPQVASASPAPGSFSASSAAAVSLTFSEAMDAATLDGALSVTALRDNLGQALNQLVAGATSYAGTTLSFAGTLAANTLYRVSLSTKAADLQGNHLAAAYVYQFQTLMDPAASNAFTDPATGTTISFSPGAFSADAYVNASTTSISASKTSADQKLRQNDGDPFRSPLAGEVVDLKIYDALGANLGASFSAPVSLSIPYSDANSDGVVDGSVPPVRASTLSVWWLDETHALWVRLPSSTVDTAAKRVTATVPHFTTFALIGQATTDLSGAYAFPVPFKPSAGHTAITFTGLSQIATVRVYTVSGELVRELSTSDGSGKLVWDVLNKKGEPVSSGVYLYSVTNDSARATGKLAIIR